MKNIKLKYLVYFYIFFLLGCEKYNHGDSDYQNLVFYDFEVKSCYAVNNEGYILNAKDRLVKVNSQGRILWEVKHDEIYTDTSSFRISDIIVSESAMFLFGSVVSVTKSFVKLLVFKYNLNGNPEWEKEILITSIYEDKAPRANEEFYEQLNNYPVVTQDINENFVISFSYDEKDKQLARNRLIELDPEGNVTKDFDYELDHFYVRVYDILVTSKDELILSRGGREYFTIDVFDRNFNLIHTIRTDGFGDPIYNKILETSGNEIYITGHIDMLDHPGLNYFTNFDYRLIHLRDDETSIDQFPIGNPTFNKELCFYSTVSRDDNLFLLISARGDGKILHDSDSDLILIKANTTGEVLEQKILIADQGLEGVYLDEKDDGSMVVIGYKTGFTTNQLHSFFLRVIPDFN